MGNLTRTIPYALLFLNTPDAQAVVQDEPQRPLTAILKQQLSQPYHLLIQESSDDIQIQSPYLPTLSFTKDSKEQDSPPDGLIKLVEPFGIAGAISNLWNMYGFVKGLEERVESAEFTLYDGIVKVTVSPSEIEHYFDPEGKYLFTIEITSNL